jgi:transposase
MRFVQMKSEEQLDMQTLHRARDRLIAERTSLINQMRAFLFERGLTAPKGPHALDRYFTATLEQESEITLGTRVRKLIEDMREE